MPLTREGRGTGLAVAIDLVNTWDELEPEPDLIEGVDDVRVWLTWHGLDRAAQNVREADVNATRAFRVRLAEVFDAPDEDEAVRLLNAIAREVGTPPQLERDGHAWRLRSWPDEDEGLRFAAAYATAGLLDGMQTFGWERFGRCAGSPCRCAFVDRSRNRTRRYCCTLCADRVAQANSRARRKGAPPPARRRDAPGED
jgi:predicted RNA-binding Zn ribbon-like protein